MTRIEQYEEFTTLLRNTGLRHVADGMDDYVEMLKGAGVSELVAKDRVLTHKEKEFENGATTPQNFTARVDRGNVI